MDTIGTVRARLTEGLGASIAAPLVADGAASELSDLVAEVRAALADLDAKGRARVGVAASLSPALDQRRVQG